MGFARGYAAHFQSFGYEQSGVRVTNARRVMLSLGRPPLQAGMVIGKGRIQLTLGGLTIIGIGVIITVKLARANASRIASSASLYINGNGDLREWQNADFLKSMELCGTP